MKDYVSATTPTVGELKDLTLNSVCSKTTLITSSVSRAGGNCPFEKRIQFFLGPWLLVCQFIKISIQMEPTGYCYANVEQRNLI